MSEYIHLIGSEQVQSAGRLIDNAADQMQRAAGTFDSAATDLGGKFDLLNENIGLLLEAIEKLNKG